MKNTFIKLFALLLALVTVLSLVACGDKSEDEETGSDGEAVDTTPIAEGEKSAWSTTALPEKNFGGEIFFVRYPVGTTFICDTFNVSAADAGKDIVKKASYDRDKVFEELTGAVISYEDTDTDPNRGTDVADIRALHQAGDLAEVDMICTGARAMGTLISEGILADLNEYDNYIKADQYWYSTGVNKQMALGGKMFAVSGYHTTLNYRYMQTIAVNNGELSSHFGDQNKINEIYDLVLNNKWTMEKMLGYGKNYASDNSGTAKDLTQDNFTFIMSVNSVQGLFHGLGGTVVEKDQNDLPAISIDSTKNQEILTYMKRALAEGKEVYHAKNDTEGEAFHNGRSLFGQYPMSGVAGLDEYGIDGRMLPLPLYQEGDAYVSNMMPWTTNLAAIPAISSDLDMATYCMEAFMALSYDYIYPEFYEKLFKTRYAEDLTESQLFDLVTTSSYIDYVETYQWQNDNTLIRKVITDTTYEVGSTVQKISEETKGYIDAFFKKYNF